MQENLLENKEKNQIYLIYDGDCPICKNVAKFYQIKENVGELCLINARSKNNPIIDEINSKKLDLDQGLVVKFQGQFYHGSDANNIMALLGSKHGFFNLINTTIFKSKFLTKIFYPIFRQMRNFTLFILGKSQINNLKINQPIFKSTFGKSWENFPQVMYKHYANRPFSNDVVVLEGKMEVKFSKLFGLFLPLFAFLKLLIPIQGKDVFSRVTLRSKPNSPALYFEREFFISKDKPVTFFSKIIPLKKNQAVEIMNYGISWKFFYSFENDKIILKHKGYALKLFGLLIPMPFSFIFGKGHAYEEAISDDEFQMKMTINHFLFGEIYCYQGKFKIIKIEL